MATNGTGRAKPNILITGTPGTGKSVTASEVTTKCGLNHIDIGQVAKNGNYYEGWDDKYQCHILDEEKIIDELDDVMSQGGNIVEYHGCDFFPERWFDAIFVLRTDNTLLFDRLQKRGYSNEKIYNNVQCEIFQTVLEEAQENYDENIVHELISNMPEDMETNIDIILRHINEFRQ